MVLLLGWGALAVAAEVPETTGNVQLLRPSVDAEHTLWTDDASRATDSPFEARGLASWTFRPLVWERDDEVQAVVGSVWQLDLLGAATLGPVRLGVDVPVLATYGSDVFAGGAAGLGDIALDGKVTLADPAKYDLGLALTTRWALPTGTVQRALARGQVDAEFSAVADYQVGDVVRLLANAGARFGAPLQLGDEVVGSQLLLRLGAAIPLGERAGVSAEFAGRLPLRGRFGLGAPAEILLGGWAQVADLWTVRGGIGRGFSSAAGAPSARAVLSLGFTPPTDGRRVIADPARARPEDDLDADQDGLEDVSDACPDEPEDLDGYLDSDGCPDPIEFAVRVHDAQGALVAGAFAWVQCEDSDARLTADDDTELDAGSCTLTVAAPSWSSVTDTFVLEEGPPVERIVQLTPLGPVAHVRVEVRDEAGDPLRALWSVTENGAAYPIRRGRGAMALLPGTHTLWFMRPGYESEQTTVELTDGDDVMLEVLLKAATER